MIAWLSDVDLVRHDGCARPSPWLDALRRTQHIGVPSAEPVLTVRDARSHLLIPDAGRDWIAVGDAAMALDPLTSTGITEAIHSGVVAADLIATRRLGSAEGQRGLGTQFAAYLQQRREIYRLERRWDSPFWTRRWAAAHHTGTAVTT